MKREGSLDHPGFMEGRDGSPNAPSRARGRSADGEDWCVALSTMVPSGWRGMEQ